MNRIIYLLSSLNESVLKELKNEAKELLPKEYISQEKAPCFLFKSSKNAGFSILDKRLLTKVFEG